MTDPPPPVFGKKKSRKITEIVQNEWCCECDEMCMTILYPYCMQCLYLLLLKSLSSFETTCEQDFEPDPQHQPPQREQEQQQQLPHFPQPDASVVPSAPPIDYENEPSVFVVLYTLRYKQIILVDG